MLSIFERMNPASCLGGSLSAVHDADGKENNNEDVVQPNTDTKDDNGGLLECNKKQSTTFGCVGHPNCYSKYQPNDEEEPLPSDVVLQSLKRTVPDLLKCISTSSPPSTIGNGRSQKEMRKAVREFNAKRTSALQQLYDLTGQEKEQNRVPLCNEQWNVIGILANALLDSTADEGGSTVNEDGDKQQTREKPCTNEGRRLICWTINNLSIPYENKAKIALGEHSTKLLHGLTRVIQNNLPETYLCCICLLNLTFLAEAIRPVTFYVPYGHGKAPYSPSRRSRSVASNQSSGSPSKQSASPLARLSSLRIKNRSINGENQEISEGRISEICGLVLGNSSSLIRVIEKMMIANAPFLLSTKKSVQGEAIRWSCGFIRNVTHAGEPTSEDGSQGSDNSLSGTTGRQGVISDESIEEICLLISQTEIPRLMVQFVKDSPRPTVKWTKDSLEDICLGAMCNMAQWHPSQEALKRAGALEVLEKIEGLPGIHGYRARAIRCSLGAIPKHFG